MSRKSVDTIHYADTNAALAGISSTKPTDLSRQIVVIGGGYSRTATISFTLALRTLLKGPVCHLGSSSLLREEEFVKKWIKALDPKNDVETTKRILKDVLAGYVACTDSPGYMFVGELAEAYPDAKVIVTTRDPEKWWESYRELLNMTMLWWVPYVFWSMPTLRWYGRWIEGMKKRRSVIYPPDAELNGPGFLEVHHDYLKRVVPADRLFFFDVKEGWEPLCKILDLPIPNEPFPHANDKIAVQQAFKGLIKEAAVRWLEILTVPALVVGAYFFLQRTWDCLM